MNDKNILLKMTNIKKTFPGVKALDNVNFNLREGEIHALMGENGAGKSTLIKVLTGVHKLDEGNINLLGEDLIPKSPHHGQRVGISTVYQEINLCPNLSVCENIFLGRQPKKGKVINWKEITKRSRELLERLDIHIDVEQNLSYYSVAIQQMVAIARAVDISSKVLILDEPTSSLDSKETKKLFNVMNKLKKKGMGIIFITHFLDQVYEVSDRITVLRNGKLVGEYKTKELNRMNLIGKMIGKDLEDLDQIHDIERKEKKSDEYILKAKNLGKNGTMSPFDLNIKKGEIVGLSGLLGSGRSEVAKLIFGIDKNDTGTITLDNEIFKSMYPKRAISKKIGFCPEERKVEGIVGSLSIRENIILALQGRIGAFNYISMKEQQKIASKYIELLKIATPSMEQRIDKLSGGNQQKVILARWLATKPKLLILDEPTRGIDIGSKAEIQKLIISLAKEGVSILFISSELEEMLRCCDRIVILRDREKVGVVEGEKMTDSYIMKIIAKEDDEGVKYEEKISSVKN
ncbi:MAG: sugar ABC transporter ATP-binding protein [Anaeromicrobium sp.]|jgi:simple sugar transport system ATP-binding protein|uniref:sugar ABC transporter ATP-binding protein n=1 Tax=Anaeromicrobium sp. TaxID=1929132 RepID=UPI0025FAA011|nr:sugar ABC transporter ATP-binding protein [Anaeromicrobium sp.]MCT4596056.1 sugar ABC transporter ATP-binding protein [Anaeromicrobium sp.]